MTSSSPAKNSNTSETGTSGGAFLCHKPWLQTAIPSEAYGDVGQHLPEGDLAYKYIRVKGLHLVICFAYFDADAGLGKANLEKFQKCIALRDRTGARLIIAGDFNMPLETFNKSAMLQIHGMQIIDSGTDGTCKHANGRSNIDYLIVDHDIAPLIDQMRIVPDLPWQPHVGISFRINRRPEHVMTNQITKPKPILYEKDDKGQNPPWTCSEDQFEKFYAAEQDNAEKMITQSKTTNKDEWEHSR